jgi:LacI family transcriptional regulator
MAALRSRSTRPASQNPISIEDNVVTLRDIAQRARVNISTVSRALNDNAEVSEATKRTIIKIAEELGYRPNQAARTLAGKSSRLIGVLLPDIRSGYFDSMMTHLGEFLGESGYSPLLTMTDFELKKEVEALELFCDRQVAGIFVALPLNDKIRDNLGKVREGYGIPIVLLESLQHWESFDDVMIDDAYGIGLAIDHLMAKGHRDIGFMTDEWNYPIRFPMFKRALAERGLEARPDFVHVSKHRFELGGFEAMGSLLSSGTRPTAVIAGYDSIAIGALKALYEAKLRVPDDMAVVGNDDIPESSFLYQALTTIAPPVRELASMGTHIMIEKIEDPANKVVHNINLRPELIIRETT